MNVNLNRNKIMAEFFSTFILIYTVLITKSTIYKILSMTFLIGFFNRYYGANFNPAISFINLTHGSISLSNFLIVVIVQLLGGLAAYSAFKHVNLINRL